MSGFSWDKQKVFLMVLNKPLDTGGVPRKGAKDSILPRATPEESQRKEGLRLFPWELAVDPGHKWSSTHIFSSHILRPPLPAWQSPSQAVRTDKTGRRQLSLGEKGPITVGSGCGKGQYEMICSSLHQALGRDLGKLILVRILTLHWLLPVLPRLRQQAPVSTRI